MSSPPAPLDCIGENLQRPESVIALRDGRLYASDRQCGVARVWPPGPPPAPAAFPVPGFVPNGIALLPDGTFLIANIGPAGGLWRLTEPGRVVAGGASQGVPATPLGFAHPDRHGRTWLALTTRQAPRTRAFRRSIADGAIGLIDKEGGMRIAAEGLGFVNEVRVDPSGDWLYATETFARRLSRYRIGRDGTLAARETVCAFGPGMWPDGFEFDARGGVWITSVVSNRLVEVRPDGSCRVHLEDCDDAQLAAAERRFGDDAFDTSDVAAGGARPLGNISSLAFGGPGLRTLYLGSLERSTLAAWQSPVEGAPPVHWDYGATVLD